MPNHYTVAGLCTRDWEGLERDGRDDIDFTGLTDMNLCQKVSPIPEELVGIVAASPLYRYVHKETGQVHKGDDFFRNENRDYYERVHLEPKEIAELKNKYGSACWYEWQSANWGTKWGTYDLSYHELGGDGSPLLIEFVSAWAPPNEETMRKINEYLRKTYYLIDIHWVGHDPYDNSNGPISRHWVS